MTSIIYPATEHYDIRITGLIHQYQPIIIGALASCPNNLYRKARLLGGRENINAARLHCRPGPLRVSALFFFHGAPPAKIAWAGTKTKNLPGTFEENFSLKLSYDCLNLGVLVKVNQNSSSVTIQNLTHLVGCRRKRRTNQTLAIAVTAELTLQSDPAGSYHLRRRNYSGIFDAGFSPCGIT
jgi:hypothetical protein